MEPLVSVIMAAYNSEKLRDRCHCAFIYNVSKKGIADKKYTI